MQPRQRDAKLIVDPIPGNKKKIMIPKPNPKTTKKQVVNPPVAKRKDTGISVKPPSVDDKIYRTMPITEKQLGSIKKMYGIK